MEEGIVRKKIQPVVSPKTSENPGGAKRNSCGFSSFNRRCSGWFSAVRMAGERRLASKIQIGTKLGQKGGRKWEIWPGHVCGFQLGFSSRLSGSIPHFLGNLSNLAVLHLGDNSLFGSIPPILGKVQSLLSLGFDLNLLNGVLPPSISNLSNLEGLYLYSSLVSPEIGNLLQLIELEIDNKQLFGQIPRSPRNFTSLNIVHLEQNHLTGNIYEVFGIYPNLTFLDLSQNNFYGEISSNWGKCQ
ncbi:hypothetical protein WN944_015699 [Citrus x changshan-huyou]|uniref:Uncharacterized protein n=1 Tax=Citrus x changshan-huyou TaxID=2935761 RepID=A0AAP0MCB7_9ROSI